MHPSRGVAKVIVLLVTVLLLTAIATAFLLLQSNTVTPVTPELLTRVLDTDSRAGGVVASNVIFTKQTERFVRGTLTDTRDGSVKTFYAMYVGDVWRIVEVTDTPVSCERFARLGFPDDFLTGCRLSFADAVTVAEIDATLDASLLAGAPLRVIGFVTDVQTTDDTSVVTITSGDASETFTVSGSALTPGDVVVVTVGELQEPGTVSGAGTSSGTYTAVRVETVGSEDAELLTGTTPTGTLPQENQNTASETQPQSSGPVSGSNSTTIYKVQAPHVAPPPQYFFNVYDIDTSFMNVQIDGSF